MIDNNTRRFPRTLVEAFGPHTQSTHIQPMASNKATNEWFIDSIIEPMPIKKINLSWLVWIIGCLSSFLALILMVTK